MTDRETIEEGIRDNVKADCHQEGGRWVFNGDEDDDETANN